MFYWFIKYLSWPLRKFYFRIEVEGVENLPRVGPAIVAANHTSFLDAGILGTVLPRKVHFLVLSEMMRMRRLGWFYRGMETIPLERGRGDHTPIRRALEVLRAGRVLGIFPEGGRSRDGRLRRPREGAALLARKSDAPVVPTAIEGAYEAFPPGRRWPRPRKIRVRFGAPLLYGENSGGADRGRDALRGFSQSLIAAIAELLSVPPPAAEGRAAPREKAQ